MSLFTSQATEPIVMEETSEPRVDLKIIAAGATCVEEDMHHPVTEAHSRNGHERIMSTGIVYDL